MTVATAAWVCLLAPLVGALLITLAGGRLSRRGAGYLATLSTSVAFVAALTGFFAMLGENSEERSHVTTAWTWLRAGDFEAGLSLLVDPLSMLMMLIVSGVGSLIVAYSIGYMDGEDEERRFFAYMAFFVFSMLLLVEGANLVLLLAGWGLVGLASYLLIGFHHERPSAIAAAKKAFVMNAVGDATMALAIFLLFWQTGVVDFAGVFEQRRRPFGHASSRSPRSGCSAGRSRSRRSSRSRRGCPTRWKARRRSAPSFTRRRWSRRACTCSFGCTRSTRPPSSCSTSPRRSARSRCSSRD